MPTIGEQLDRLGRALSDHTAWWQPSVFADDPPWTQSHPHVAAALLGLDDATLEAFEQAPEQAAAWLTPQLPGLADMDGVVEAIEQSALPEPLPLPETHGRDIPGRKWQQILHFAALCEPPPEQTDTVLEWCSGKAHLGRLLAQRQNRPLIGVEWQAALCQSAQGLAGRDGVDLTMHHANVLTTPASGLLKDAQEVVALHACGDLHRRLLEALPASAITRLHLAPCCYHLTKADRYQPLSRQGQQHAPPLTRQDLHLVTQQVVVASSTKVARTRQLMQWRLAFDWLQRHWQGEDRYLPTPSRSTRVLRDGFASFVADMAAHHGLSVPSQYDAEAALAAGERQLARGRRLALLRHRFRRALEVWLVLDRACFLQEQGFRVNVTRFCPFQVTPRNLIIQAQRRAG